MLNSVLVGFLGQIDLEQHTTKDRKSRDDQSREKKLTIKLCNLPQAITSLMSNIDLSRCITVQFVIQCTSCCTSGSLHDATNICLVKLGIKFVGLHWK